MKNKWIFIIIPIIAIIIATIIFIIVHKEKHVNHFDFPITLKSHNYTNYERADTMTMIILNKILMYDTIEVNIYYMTSEISNNDIDVQAFIQKNPFVPHTYYLFIKKGSLTVPIDKILSHEMIHVEQMENGNLLEIGGDYFIFEGKTYQYTKVPYSQRPQEIEAFKKQDKILKELNTLLYSK
jgi:hypothetical protein